MKTLSLLVFAILVSRSAHAYYGRHSTEAILHYHAKADVIFDADVILPEALNSAGELRTRALKRIAEQVQHLMGTFQSVSFRNEFDFPGALGEGYRIRFTNVAEGSGPGRKLLDYDFEGTVVFQKEAFRHTDTRTVPIKLPLAPDLVYGLGLKHGRNHCTDRDFNGPEDFWYYWDPDQPGCALIGNDSDVLRLSGELTRLPNTELTYPEYDRLYGDNGNGRNLDIAILVGYIRWQNIDGDHVNHHDEALVAFHAIERDLKARGFEQVAKIDAFRVQTDGTQKEGINYLRRYERDTNFGGARLRTRVLMLLADTDMDSKDETFHHYFIPALRFADVLAYDGHSDLGHNFDLNLLPKAVLDPNKYQVFFINGCSTYPYLNGMYFHAKGGTRNLELITAGLPTLTSSSAPNAIAFLDPFLEARTPSYQRILQNLEASNGDAGTYLMGVKGDEDNEWTPQRGQSLSR